MNRWEAEAAGFTVDRHCYPWVAYKGDRFRPTEIIRIPTDVEARRGAKIEELQATIQAAADNMACGPADIVEWSRKAKSAALYLDDLTKPDGTIEKLIAALNRANDLLFATGAPLGTQSYFDIRNVLVDAIKDAGGVVT